MARIAPGLGNCCLESCEVWSPAQSKVRRVGCVTIPSPMVQCFRWPTRASEPVTELISLHLLAFSLVASRCHAEQLPTVLGKILTG